MNCVGKREGISVRETGMCGHLGQGIRTLEGCKTLKQGKV